METQHIVHTIPPVFDSRSRVLILGTMPSPKSREQGFYYGHPQNRFWRVLAGLFQEETPQGAEERRAFALSHQIALWDVLASCDIAGASDSSIRSPVPNDIAGLLQQAPVRAVFTTGKTAGRLYQKLCRPSAGMDAVVLPSPSPANCQYSLEKLTDAYRGLLQFLRD